MKVAGTIDRPFGHDRAPAGHHRVPYMWRGRPGGMVGRAGGATNVASRGRSCALTAVRGPSIVFHW